MFLKKSKDKDKSEKSSSKTDLRSSKDVEGKMAKMRISGDRYILGDGAPLDGGGKLFVRIVEGREIYSKKNGDAVKPFCMVEFEHNQILTPSSEGPKPKWNHEFHFDVTEPDGELQFIVYDRAALKGGNDCIGTVSIVPSYEEGRLYDDWFDLRLREGAEKSDAKLHIQISFKKQDSKGLTINDFELLKVIGKGSFGKVMQVRKKDTKRIYAMKILTKSHLVERDEVAHTRSERKILAKNTNPFLVGLKFSFQTKEKIYLVLDYINGGELFFHLQNEGKFPEPRAKFYAAQLVLAIEDLHRMSIIYRDLKPENILVDYSGYIALTDFGLCKEDVQYNETTNTFCGTPEYMAPEVLQQKGYGPPVDWWTLGILLYEMLTGLPPFYDENTNQMYHKILFGDLTFTDEVSSKARSLITGLLQRDPKKRLGSGRTDAEDVKKHPFFADIDWDELLKKKIKPPWKPQLDSKLDTSNFDPEFTEMTPKDSMVQSSHLSKTVQDQFKGFTYVDDSELSRD
eukprot:Opistho-1_new@91705